MGMHAFAFICIHVCVGVCLAGTSWGDVKCHTSWEAGGVDVARAPFSILSPKISPGHPISSEGVECGSEGLWATWLAFMATKLSQLVFSTWDNQKTASMS